jgi:hypothetical protein
MKYCCQSGGFYQGQLHQLGGFYAGPKFQRGGAIRGFSGPEYQVGGKWQFGSFLWRHAKPLLSYLGKKALSTGVGIGQDLVEGKDFKESAKSRIKSAGKDVAVHALDQVKSKIQAGKGRKRIKRRKSKRKTPVRRKKPSTTARRRRTRKNPPRARRTRRVPIIRKRKVRRRRTRRRKTTLSTIFDQ